MRQMSRSALSDTEARTAGGTARQPRTLGIEAAPLAHRVTDAARLLGIGKTSIYALFKSGALRPIRIGGRTLVPASELHRLIAEAEAAL